MSIISSARNGRPRYLRYTSVLAAAVCAQAISAVRPENAANANTPSYDTLRICAASNQLPYSSIDGAGFENKIAAAVATAMNRKPVFIYSDKPAIYLVRDFLDKKKCDVIVGLDTNDQRVSTTKPTYRASYVFVSRRDKHITVSSWNDPGIKKLGHIVVDFGSPSEAMLKELGLYSEDMAYLYSLVGFRAPRNEYVQISPEKMIAEVKSGGADLAVAFAPDISRYVKSNPDLIMVPVKDDAVHNKDERLPQQYDQSMAVRLGDTALLADLNAAIVKAKPGIKAILLEEGIPLIESGK